MTVRRYAYLRAPIFRAPDGSDPGQASALSRLVERIADGDSRLDRLAEAAVAEGGASDPVAAESALAGAFADPAHVIGVAELDLEDRYDIIAVEQGYGGVYVHTVELLKRLRKTRRALLLAPVDPLFEPRRHQDDLTLTGLRERIPGLSYFSYLSLLRSIVRDIPCGLLLIAHRSQSLYLFDLIRSRRTVIYCDGYYDGQFALAEDCGFVLDEPTRRAVLHELRFLNGNTPGDYCGTASNPLINVRLLAAGAFALRDAAENWCWGAEQTSEFHTAFPSLADRVRFVPPFTDPSLFDPAAVRRERLVLFTTTMHNIEKKGFPQILEALQAIPDLAVRCVVRRPDLLPKIPEEVAARLEIGPIPKSEFVSLYHRIWLNCRVSREESSPISVLESMICEVPQIVSPVVARQIPLMEDGATGFVVDPDDGPALARALHALLGDPALRDRMGRTCRERASTYALERREGEIGRFLS